MTKDKHEVPEVKKTVPALVEGHSSKAKPQSHDSVSGHTGIYDGLLPVDSVPGTQYYLTIKDDGSVGVLVPVSDDGIPVGSPVLRVFHTDQPGQDKLLSESGAPLGQFPQPTPDFRFKMPDALAITDSNKKYATNRREHDHENAARIK